MGVILEIPPRFIPLVGVASGHPAKSQRVHIPTCWHIKGRNKHSSTVLVVRMNTGPLPHARRSTAYQHLTERHFLEKKAVLFPSPLPLLPNGNQGK